MSDFARIIDKAIAELRYAKEIGPQYAQAALTQARGHINLALDDARRKAMKPEPDRPVAEPVTAHPTVG